MTKEQTNTNTQELTAEQRAAQIRELRGGRRALDGLNSRYPQLPPRTGFKTHWFNDEKGRVNRALRDGWVFSERPGYTDKGVDLEKNPKKRIGVRVGTKEDLSDLFAYAMDIPTEIYDEDRRAKLESVDRKEQYIKEGKVETAGAAGLDYKVESDIKSNFQPD